MQSYRAILDGDRIHWIDPPDFTGPTKVRIHFLDEEEEDARRARGERMAKALEKVSEADGGFASIPDPAAWEREIRRDRPLPGREDDEPGA